MNSERVALGEVVCDSVDQSGPVGDEFIYIDIGSIDRESKRIVNAKILTATQAPNRAKQRLKIGDVLVSMTRPNLNAVAMVTAEFDGAIGSTGFYVIRSKYIYSKFFFYLVQSRDFIGNMTSRVQGALYPAVRPKDVSSYIFILPPLQSQQRIVAKIEELFSELDKGIESLKTAREQLKVYRQAVLKHAFEGKLTARWRGENKDKIETPEQIFERIEKKRESIYQQQLAEWKDFLASPKENGTIKKPSNPRRPAKIHPMTKDVLEDLPHLPEGWAWLRVGDLCEVVRGGSPRPAGDKRYYDGSIPFLKVADLTRNPGSYLKTYSYTIKEAGLTKTRYVEPNTLMISNSGATLGVPKVCLIGATFNDGIAAFLGLDPSSLLYHCYFWESKTETLRTINQGAAQPNLNTNLLKDVLIPVCSPAEMETVSVKIERSLSICDQIISEIENGIAQSEILRQSILKKAFSGQLVPQDPNDEPASVLLERIQAEKAARPKAGKTRAGRQTTEMT